jgi:ATP-dependent Lon protease
MDKFTLGPNVIEKLINSYCREPGVRSLEKYVKKIIEKVAYTLVQNPETTHVMIQDDQLDKYLGHPVFPSTRVFANPPEVLQ